MLGHGALFARPGNRRGSCTLTRGEGRNERVGPMSKTVLTGLTASLVAMLPAVACYCRAIGWTRSAHHLTRNEGGRPVLVDVLCVR
jgi:hypothetical protein